MNERDAWQAAEERAGEGLGIVQRITEALEAAFGPWLDKIIALFDELSANAPAYRPPTRARQAEPWELRGQAASLNAVPAWQRCPHRHWNRESRDRWQRERVA